MNEKIQHNNGPNESSFHLPVASPGTFPLPQPHLRGTKNLKTSYFNTVISESITNLSFIWKVFCDSKVRMNTRRNFLL